jgi:hypothetical protein
LFTNYGIKATFFIQEDEICQTGTKFQTFWKSLLQQEHEIGYHAHGLIKASLHKKEEIITTGLHNLNKTGINPVSFRGGRYHFNSPLLKILENNNIKYDSSVVPGLQERFSDGTIRCDHIGAPTSPYFPSNTKHIEKGASNILELPINRYPRLPSDRWGGILIGSSNYEEILFDYFYEIRKDRLIIIAFHSWDGLSSIVQKFVRSKKYGPTKRFVYGSIKKIIAPDKLIHTRYLERFETFIQYVLSKKDVQFNTIKDAGENIIGSIRGK